ncbi:MAG: MMPL family transporter, partial [Thermoanaerobaculia bacterium]|nr:MMPL family transporter [Thermoanaerobaculia bacterium]
MALGGEWSSRDLLRRIARFARRRYGWVFAAALALMAGSVGLARRLSFDTDVLALLPREEPAVRAYRQALVEFGSVDYLLVVVRVPEGALLEPYEAFVDELGKRLEASPDFLDVRYRIAGLEELLRTLLPHAPLYLERQGLERLERLLSDEAIRRRALELKRLISTPQSLAVKELVKLDPLGIAPVFIERFTAGRGGLSLDWSSGHLLSRDHRMLLLLAQPRASPQEVDFTRAMLAGVEAEIDRLRGEWPRLVGPEAPQPRVDLGGRHLIGLGDAELIRHDVVTGILTSMIGVLLLFLFAFRRVGALLYAFLPLAFGLVLAFGFAEVTYGSLSSATSGCAALLIGLGIDFVIVSYGRFVEERHRGGGLEEGLAQMSGSSGRAVLVGAVTSAATFYAFGVTDFPGLSQMGYLTGTGILFCMLGVVVLLPALLAWSEDHHRRRRQRTPRLFLHGLGSGRLIRLSFARPRWALAAAGAVTLIAGAAAFGLRFEDSVQSMRPRGNPAFELREEVSKRFGLGFDQMMLIVEAPTLEELLELVDRAAGRSAPLVEDGTLQGVDHLGSLLPPIGRQLEALAWL